MKLQPLEFEKPVLELESKLADLRNSSAASDINIETEACRLEEKLVQTRLAILDLSPSGHQPMASPCGRWQLVFNGEIYNHASLRQRLEAEGERFQGSGDTEVLLRWMTRRGRAGLADLRGMYAFCLVDNREGTALLARDPHGIKPLYIWQGPSGELAFASELRALLASDRIPGDPTLRPSPPTWPAARCPNRPPWWPG